MPNYLYRTDDSAIISAVAGVSNKITAVRRLANQWQIEANAELTTADCISIKNMIAYRSPKREISREAEGENSSTFTPIPADGSILKASASRMEPEPLAITTNQDWTAVCGIVTTPGFFISCASRVIIRFIGDVRSNGSGAEIRLVEQSADGQTTRTLATLSVPSTAGAWAIMRLDNAEAASLATSRFIVEARLNGASSLDVRFFTLSLLEKI